MQLRAFRGRDLATVFSEARHSLGDDALILHSRSIRDGKRSIIEVLAVDAPAVSRFRRLLKTEEPVVPRRVLGNRTGPFVVALVGPTGAGKTTTAAKLAVHTDAFGKYRVGFLALDTYRAGALDQLQAYADAAELPVEIVYDSREVDAAKKRLSNCDVIIVDTPGRGPGEHRAEWQNILTALHPNETHLVVPATLRADIAHEVGAQYARFGTTHALLTKMDEVPNDAMIAQLVGRVALPMRWVTDGQDIPSNLSSAAPQLLNTLEIAPREMAS